MFFASSSLQIHLVEVLLDHYSPTPYYYATPKIGHAPPVKCPRYLPTVKRHLPVTRLRPTLKVLPILAAYPYLTVATEMEITEMWICGWYWQFSMDFNQGGK